MTRETAERNRDSGSRDHTEKHQWKPRKIKKAPLENQRNPETLEHPRVFRSLEVACNFPNDDVQHEEQEDRASCTQERENETGDTANVEDALITTPPFSIVSAQLDMMVVLKMLHFPASCSTDPLKKSADEPAGGVKTLESH